MNYRTLGRTGLRVSEVGFGCGNVGGLMVRGSFHEQLEGVQWALDLGVNYFDTAPSYGDGLSETNLGRVLDHLKPQAWVATKVNLRHGLDDIKGAARRSLEESLKRLGRDSVDIFQLHDGITMQRGGGISGETIGLDDVLGKDGVADAFDDLRSEGLIRFAGFTGNGDTSALHKVVDSGRFDVVQAYYNLLNPSAGVSIPSGFVGHDFRHLIDRAAGHEMGVVVIRVMAAGALGGASSRQGHASPTIGSPMVTDSAYDADEERASKLDFLVSGDIRSRPQAAVRFALMHTGVSTVLVGFSSRAQIEEGASASEKRPIPHEALSRLHQLWASDFGRL